jgi:mycothiol system anti-sigma-R factor
MGSSFTFWFKKNFGRQKQEHALNQDKRTCLEILNLVLDEEATPEQREYFKQHLENCLPYYEIYQLDKTLKDRIKKSCCGKDVPHDLIESIKTKISENQP